MHCSMRCLKFILGTPRITQLCSSCTNLQYFNHKYSRSLPNKHVSLNCCSTSTSTSFAKDDTRLQMLASRVLELNIKFDVMASCVPVGKVSDMLRNLFGLGFSEKAAVDLLSILGWSLRQPELLMNILNIFKSYKLTTNSMATILENLPPEFKEERLSLELLPGIFASNLEGLTKLGFTSENIVMMLSTEPRVVFMSFTDCVDIMNKLNGLVDKSVKVTDLVLRCPNVLMDDWEEIMAKFEYAYYNMGYELVDIAKSSIFMHPFDYLKDRHIYLVRTGFFVTIKRKYEEKIQNPNPKLRSVLDSSDSQFAKMFGNLSKDEYSVYLEMRKLKKENEDSESDESESETS